MGDLEKPIKAELECLWGTGHTCKKRQISISAEIREKLYVPGSQPAQVLQVLTCQTLLLIPSSQ